MHFLEDFKLSSAKLLSTRKLKTLLLNKKGKNVLKFWCWYELGADGNFNYKKQKCKKWKCCLIFTDLFLPIIKANEHS